MSHMKPFEHLKIPLEAIKTATNNFASESRIGKGGFGRVYKGKIDGQTTVALKRLDRAFGQGDTEFWKEVMMLSRYKHVNIVSLLGFCCDSGEKILVYEYVPNKSLDKYLNDVKLGWIERLKICIGAARGLAYLHSAAGTQQRVLHRDIKSSNILLDEDWNAKISDFGLSKLGPANQEHTFMFTNQVGTLGYCDPLYAETGFLTKESDVFSFGVVLFEVLCGRLCIESKNVRHPRLIEFAIKSRKENTINEIVYGNIKDEIDPNSLLVFAKIAYQCLERDRKDRPLMSDIVVALETALFYQEARDDPFANSYFPPEDPPKAVTMASKSEGAGLLVVTVHKGVNFKVKHPYVGLSVGDELKFTKTKFNNQNPVWRETFQFILDKPSEAMLHLEVCSKSRMDKFLHKAVEGLINISLADVVKQKHVNNIYDVGNGEILVELLFVGNL